MAEEFEIARAVYRIEVAGIADAEKALDTLVEKIGQFTKDLQNLKSSLNSATNVGDSAQVADLTAKIKALEDEIEKLKAKESSARKEIDARTSSQKQNTTATDAQTKATAIGGTTAEKVASQFRTYGQAISAVSAARKQANETGESVSIKGLSDENLKASVFSAQQLADIERELNFLSLQHNKIWQDLPPIINSANLADERNIAIARQRIAVLKQAIEGAGSSTEIKLGGNFIDVSELQSEKSLLENFVATFDRMSKQVTQDVNTVQNSMRELELEIQRLAPLVDQLSEKGKGLGVSISSQQWQSIKQQLISINPDFERFTLDMVRSGEVGKELGTVLFGMRERLLDFQRSISGRNTLVGDYTKGIVDAFKQTGFTNLLQEQRVELQKTLIDQTVKISDLRFQLRSLRTDEAEEATRIKNEISNIGKAQANTVSQIKNINNAFKESGSLGGGVTNALAQGFDNLGKKILQTAGIYIGFQAAISGISRAIQIDKEVTDKFSDLQRVLQTTKEGVDGVVESLRKIDTRTPISELADMAVVAAKAGVAKDDIAGVTEAMNRLKLVVGKDFGGDIETATENLVKLVNIFIGPGKATADNISRISNAIITLDQSGVATADFITKFSEEMSGVAGITKIALPSVLGLGAAFQETGIRAEVSSTAISQILIRIGSNIQKYAALANNVKISDVTTQQVDAFRSLIREDPGEALIQLAVGLKKDKDAFDEFGAAFADLGAKGFKVTSVFGDLADKADFFRQKIELSKNALQGQNVILEGAALKEENLAGVLDKIGAKFQLAFTSPEFLNAVKTIGNGILTLTNLILAFPFKVIIGGVAAVSAAYLAYRFNLNGVSIAQRLFNSDSLTSRLINKSVELGILDVNKAEDLRRRVTAASSIENKNLRASVQATMVQEAIATERKTLLTEAQELENAATVESNALQQTNAKVKAATTIENQLLAASETEATIATEEFNVATAASPLGIILAVLGLLIPLFGAFGSKIDDTTKKINTETDALKINADIQKSINDEFAKGALESQSKVQSLINVLTKEHTTLDTRKAIYAELVKASPIFIGTLNDQFEATNRLIDANNRFVKSLEDVSRAKGFQALREQVDKDAGEIQGKIFGLQTDIEKAKIDLENLKGVTTIQQATKISFTPEELAEAEKGTVGASEAQVKLIAVQIRRNKLQEKINQNEKDLTKTLGDQKDIQERQTIVHDKIDEETQRINENLKTSLNIQTGLEKSISEIQDVATKEKNTRLERLNAAQIESNNLEKKLQEARDDNNKTLIEKYTKEQDEEKKKIEQFSIIGKNEKELNDLQQNLTNVKRDVTQSQSNLLLTSGVEEQNTEKFIDTTVKNVKSQDEVISLLEQQRDKYNDMIVQTIKEIESVDKNSHKANELQVKLTGLINARNLINKKLKELGVSLSSKEGLSPQESSLLKFLEAEKDLELAEEEDRFSKIKAIRKATLDEETFHNQKMFQITEFWNGKMVDAIDGSNNAELLKRAQISKQTEDLELETNQRILQLRQNFLDEDSRVERKHLDARKSQLEEEFESIKGVTDISNIEVASAHQHNTEILLQETLNGYQKLIVEAQRFGLSTEVLEEERTKRISEINKDAIQAQREIYDAFFSDIDTRFKKQLNNQLEVVNTVREKILSSSSSQQRKQEDLDQLDKIQKVLETVNKLTDAQQKYRQMQIESNIQLKSAVKIEEDYLHSQVQSNLAKGTSLTLEDKFAKESGVVLDATQNIIKSTGELDSSLKNVLTTQTRITQATQQQTEEQHTLVVQLKEQLNKDIIDLSGGLNDISKPFGIIKQGIESVFKGFFTIDDKDIEAAAKKGEGAVEELQKRVKKKAAARGVLGDILTSTFQTAQQAMQTYFDNELANIERNKKAQEDRVDIETTQLKARAQSQAESDAIDREAAAKKKAIERDAANDEKKVKIGQLKMALALEIANTAASAAKLVFPFNLIEFAILSGLAYARYALNVAAVNSATFGLGGRLVSELFEKGGKLGNRKLSKGIDLLEEENENIKKHAFGGTMDTQTIRGGKVKGRTHSSGGNKFIFKGRIFEDEVDELNIIRTKNAPKNRRYQITGTQEQIASALNEIGGGVRFAPGANLTKFDKGGQLTKLSNKILNDNLYVENNRREINNTTNENEVITKNKLSRIKREEFETRIKNLEIAKNILTKLFGNKQEDFINEEFFKQIKKNEKEFGLKSDNNRIKEFRRYLDISKLIESHQNANIEHSERLNNKIFYRRLERLSDKKLVDDFKVRFNDTTPYKFVLDRYSRNEKEHNIDFSRNREILSYLNYKSPAFSLHAPNPTILVRPNESNVFKIEQHISSLTKEMIDVTKQVKETNRNIDNLAFQVNTRIDNLKVQVVAKEVIKTDNSTKMATSIGRL